ncbi:MAG: hypothetical protein LBU42_07925 [Prevotellaceae bacterium]|nr:hypothetical protein [Prevotellaceae bacterium]
MAEKGGVVKCIMDNGECLLWRKVILHSPFSILHSPFSIEKAPATAN